MKLYAAIGLIMLALMPHAKANWPGAFDEAYFSQAAGAAAPTWNLEITTTATNQAFTIGTSGATNLLIAWGDGSTSNYNGSSTVSHTYSNAAIYTVAIRGHAALLQFNTTPTRVTKVLNEINGITGLRSLDYAFNAASSLTYIPGNLLVNNGQVTSFLYFCYGCNKLTNAPYLNDNTNTVQLAAAFAFCTILSNTPAISNLTKATTLGILYRGSGATSFSYVNSLTNNTSLAYTYMSCDKAPIFPDYDEQRKLTTIDHVHYGCTRGVYFSRLDNLTNLQNASYAYQDCKSLTNIPVATNWVNTNLTTVAYMFAGNTNLQGYAIPFWNTNQFPKLTGSNQCYNGCTNLVNYGDIPAGWK